MIIQKISYIFPRGNEWASLDIKQGLATYKSSYGSDDKGEKITHDVNFVVDGRMFVDFLASPLIFKLLVDDTVILVGDDDVPARAQVHSDRSCRVSVKYVEYL